MNIGVDIRCLMDKNRTGVGEYTYNLLNAVFEIDKVNQYYLFYNSNQNVSNSIPKWNENNVHYVYTRWPNKLLNLLVFLGILKLDNLVIEKCFKINNLKSKIDVWFSPNLNFTNLSKGIKRIQTIHDLSFEILPECFTFKQRLWHKFLNPRCQCQQADVVLVPSENTKRDVLEKYKVKNENLKILKPSLSRNMERVTVNLEQTRQKYNLPDNFILYLGTIEPRKNIDSIVEAFKYSGLKTKNYELIVAGSLGWKYKGIIKKISSTLGVRYIGYVNDEEKLALYSLSKLFVYPSFYEGFGIPILEAMASGVPVITSNRSSMSEVGQGAVWYVNPSNISELSDSMKTIILDDNLRSKIIENQKKVVDSARLESSVSGFIACF